MPQFIVISVSFFIFCVLYAPQPLLPLFAATFSVSESQAALLITASFLPLALAPLSYGYLLQSVSSIKVLRFSVLGLALSQLAFILADAFMILVVLRFVQGLLLPAAFTSIMTYISVKTQGAALQRLMSIYIAVSIMGGYLGRLLSGAAATYLTWQAFAWLLVFVLLLYVFLLGRLEYEARIRSAKPNSSTFINILKTNNAYQLYLAASCLFFVFAGVTNYLPFRLPEILSQPSEFITGLMYSGYLIGILTSLGSQRLCALFGSQANALLVGFGSYITALLIALTPNIWILFLAFCLTCGAMFLLHPVAATMVNQQATENRGIVNGMYLTFYYAGGTLGSYLPGIIYQQFGWAGVVMLLVGVSGMGFGMVWRYSR